MLDYKGYFGTVEIDTDQNVLHGRVINTRDVISYVAETAETLLQEFKTSIDIYLESCKEDGVDPDKPYSGNLNLRLGPELHKRAAIAAAAAGISINELIKRQLDKTVDHEYA